MNRKWNYFKQNVGTVKLPKSNKQLSTKQVAALERGRRIHQENILNRYFEQANRSFVGDENARLTREKYIKKLQYTSEIENVSIREAHQMIMHTFPYISKADNYKYQIFQYVDKNELRLRVAMATGTNYNIDKNMTVRVKGGFDYENVQNQFVYDPASESLLGVFVNANTGESTTIKIRIVEGETSDQPNFVVIE